MIQDRSEHQSIPKTSGLTSDVVSKPTPHGLQQVQQTQGAFVNYRVWSQ